MMGHDGAGLWDTFEAQEKLQKRVARLERTVAELEEQLKQQAQLLVDLAKQGTLVERLFRGQFEVCPKCGGTGEFQDFPAHDESPADALIRCPACHGTGVVPTETFRRLVSIVLAEKGVILPWEV